MTRPASQIRNPNSAIRNRLAHPLPFAFRTLRLTRSLPLAVLTLLLALTALPFAASAQSATATLSGTVEDQNGAVVPGATVTVKNPNTGLNRQTTTNDAGYFTVPLLSPGTYADCAEAAKGKAVRAKSSVSTA